MPLCLKEQYKALQELQERQEKNRRKKWRRVE